MSIDQISPRELAFKILNIDKVGSKEPQPRYAIFLGAGASVESTYRLSIG